MQPDPKQQELRGHMHETHDTTTMTTTSQPRIPDLAGQRLAGEDDECSKQIDTKRRRVEQTVLFWIQDVAKLERERPDDEGPRIQMRNLQSQAV